jgi:ribulose-phosphate 3-epimerase
MPTGNMITSPPTLPLVAASILGADFADLGVDCRRALEAGADLLHVDVMDGHFVPNLTMGPALCRSLRRTLPNAFMDVHLMVTDPARFVEPFAEAGVDHLTFHVEVVEDPAALADRIRACGLTAGLAINPPTPVERAEPWLAAFDLILVMSVNPGFSGQSFIGDALEKTRRYGAMLGPAQRLQMDGGVGRGTAKACRDAGCDVLVAASAIFNENDYVAAIQELRGDTAVTRSG